MAKHHVTATINGDVVEFLCETNQTLLDVLRDDLSLTGTKEGCGTGDCGACSVTVDARLMCSCLILGVEAEGKAIQTIEGMAVGEKLHPLQRKFLEHAALQCGICTPGVLIAARSLLERNPDPTEEELASRPPARHRLVQVHPGSKRKTLYLASHASHIEGWPIEEGRALLRELTEFATQPQFVLRHQWRLGDLVIWDNWCSIHAANCTGAAP